MFLILRKTDFSMAKVSPIKSNFSKRFYSEFLNNISKVAGFDMAKEIYTVDFPLTDVGEGINAWIKATNDNVHSIIYNGGDFRLSNVTPHTFNRLRKSGHKKVFYLSHYKVFYNRDVPYTVHFMWPMWVGRAPKKMLTQHFTEWHNPWNKNRITKIYVGEFAFVNMLHLPNYANSWELLDFTKSPWDSVVGEKWWREHFMKREGFKPSLCFGYAVYCFTPGFKHTPAYVPALGSAVDEQWKPETDPYKATMVEANRRMDEIPEHWFWEKEACEREEALLEKIKQREKFVKKWSYLGFHPDKPMKGLEIQDPLNAYLPDGKLKDPDGENIQEYFNKAIDPATYHLRFACPPEDFDALHIYKTWLDKMGDDWLAPENDWFTPRYVDPWGKVYTLDDLDDTPEVVAAKEADDLKYEWCPGIGWKRTLWADRDEILDPSNPKDMRKIDKIIRRSAEKHIAYNESLGLIYPNYDDKLFHIRLIERGTRVNMGLPPTPVHTPPLSDDEMDHLSSDEEGTYSASWAKYGDISDFKHFWDDGDGLENEIANDLMEDWAQELRDERGSRNDSLDWKEIAESSYEGLLPAQPNRDTDWSPINYFQKQFFFWDDPRHEE